MFFLYIGKPIPKHGPLIAWKLKSIRSYHQLILKPTDILISSIIATYICMRHMHIRAWPTLEPGAYYVMAGSRYFVPY
jgi:hypothetical protein